jgi:hypothetical protein
MRIEQFMPTHMVNYTQWYVNCAHVNIMGTGGGTPTGFAKFPGTYDIDHPGKQARFSWTGESPEPKTFGGTNPCLYYTARTSCAGQPIS